MVLRNAAGDEKRRFFRRMDTNSDAVRDVPVFAAPLLPTIGSLSQNVAMSDFISDIWVFGSGFQPGATVELVEASASAQAFWFSDGQIRFSFPPSTSTLADTSCEC